MKCAKTERELTAHPRLVSGFCLRGNQATLQLANYFTLVSHVLNAYGSRLVRKIHNCSADGNGKVRAYIQKRRRWGRRSHPCYSQRNSTARTICLYAHMATRQIKLLVG